MHWDAQVTAQDPTRRGRASIRPRLQKTKVIGRVKGTRHCKIDFQGFKFVRCKLFRVYYRILRPEMDNTAAPDLPTSPRGG